MKYFLDTNILLIYLRANNRTEKLEQYLRLFSDRNELYTSVVSIGEIKSIMIQNNWGNRRIQKAIEFLNDFYIIDINVESIIDKYAEIDAYSQAKSKYLTSNFSARNMGKNDLWIAATASIFGLRLLTTDLDFNHLQSTFLDLQTINMTDFK